MMATVAMMHGFYQQRNSRVWSLTSIASSSVMVNVCLETVLDPLFIFVVICVPPTSPPSGGCVDRAIEILLRASPLCLPPAVAVAAASGQRLGVGRKADAALGLEHSPPRATGRPKPAWYGANAGTECAELAGEATRIAAAAATAMPETLMNLALPLPLPFENFSAIASRLQNSGWARTPCSKLVLVSLAEARTPSIPLES